MGKNIICKNAVCNYESAWKEKRASFIKQQYVKGSTCLSKGELQDIGCDLNSDLQALGQRRLPKKFVNIGKL